MKSGKLIDKDVQHSDTHGRMIQWYKIDRLLMNLISSCRTLRVRLVPKRFPVQSSPSSVSSDSYLVHSSSSSRRPSTSLRPASSLHWSSPFHRSHSTARRHWIGKSHDNSPPMAKERRRRRANKFCCKHSSEIHRVFVWWIPILWFLCIQIW